MIKLLHINDQTPAYHLQKKKQVQIKIITNSKIHYFPANNQSVNARGQKSKRGARIKAKKLKIIPKMFSSLKQTKPHLRVEKYLSEEE